MQRASLPFTFNKIFSYSVAYSSLEDFHRQCRKIEHVDLVNSLSRILPCLTPQKEFYSIASLKDLFRFEW